MAIIEFKNKTDEKIQFQKNSIVEIKVVLSFIDISYLHVPNKWIKQSSPSLPTVSLKCY